MVLVDGVECEKRDVGPRPAFGVRLVRSNGVGRGTGRLDGGQNGPPMAGESASRDSQGPSNLVPFAI
jgi:hypothetical protein